MAWELSSLTKEEYGAVVATFRAVRNEEFNCQKCLAKYPDTEDGERRSKWHRGQRMGCFGGDGKKVFWRWANVEFLTCLGNARTDEAAGWMTLWHHWKRSETLPFAGCLSDQPAKIMEAFDVFEMLEELRKQDEKRANAPEGT